jgi:hypothetical protein
MQTLSCSIKIQLSFLSPIKKISLSFAIYLNVPLLPVILYFEIFQGTGINLFDSLILYQQNKFFNMCLFLHTYRRESRHILEAEPL